MKHQDVVPSVVKQETSVDHRTDSWSGGFVFRCIYCGELEGSKRLVVSYVVLTGLGEEWDPWRHLTSHSYSLSLSFSVYFFFASSCRFVFLILSNLENRLQFVANGLPFTFHHTCKVCQKKKK